MTHQITMPPLVRIGLSEPTSKPILNAIRRHRMPILVSANLFACKGYSNLDLPKHLRSFGRTFNGFRPVPQELLGLDVALDSAGYVMWRRYGSFIWSPQAYIRFAASFPFTWVAQMDYACEPQLAPTEEAVRARLAMTANMYHWCKHYADKHRVNLIPVLQGVRPDHYMISADYVEPEAGTLIGLGSFCRRPTRDMEAIIDRLDRTLDPSIKFHLFGVESAALSVFRDHPRLTGTASLRGSVDSSAWNESHRRYVHRRGEPATATSKAFYLTSWYAEQIERLTSRPRRQLPPGIPPHLLPPGIPRCRVERAYRDIIEEYYELIACGEIPGNANIEAWALTEIADRLDQYDETRA